jgi:putative ABC transport system permease protein
MTGTIKLAWKYILFHKAKSLILIACIFLTMILPIAIAILLGSFNEQIVARADETPVVLGAEGSSLDLALHTLYFRNQPASLIMHQVADDINKDSLAQAIPIHSLYTAQDFPVVGTSLEYFSFRRLQLEEGNQLALLGDCVLGEKVSRELGLRSGDQLLTDSENVLGLAADYPLMMNVVGVLKASGTADDSAVFVDVKTAWVIQGFGHGHQDLTDETEKDKLLSKEGEPIVASSAVVPYTRITDKNLRSFHFHGKESEFPVSAVIVVPVDEKGDTILEGRFQSDESKAQFVRPASAIRQLMSLVFRVKKFFDANAILVAISTLMLLALVVLLSLRLRKREMDTMFRLGCSRDTIVSIQLAEMGIIFFVALLLVAAATGLIWFFSADLVNSWLTANS